jgi:hypothetical protein
VAFPGFDISVSNLTATVSVSGIGTGTFDIPTITADTPPLSVVGIGAPIQDRAILFVSNPAFVAYELSTSIGPLSGPAMFNPGEQFGTTLGNFSLTSVSTVTFQAVVVPEPATASLLALGGLALAVWRKGGR